MDYLSVVSDVRSPRFFVEQINVVICSMNNETSNVQIDLKRSFICALTTSLITGLSIRKY